PPPVRGSEASAGARRRARTRSPSSAPRRAARRPRRRRPRRAPRHRRGRASRGPDRPDGVARARAGPGPRHPRGAGRERPDPGRRPARTHRRSARVTVWREAGLVAGKDLRIETRSRVALAQILPFGLIVILLFAFALDPDRGILGRVAPGLFWVAVLLAAL